MKEFINRHPFITLFALDCVVTGIVKVVTVLRTGQIPWDCVETTEGDATDLAKT